MEEKGKVVKKSYWLTIMIVQSVFMLGIMIWAITQKVEAEKQKVLALAAKQEAERAKDSAKEAEKAKYNALVTKEEFEKYKLLYPEKKGNKK